jgi:hypothetical protein
MSHIQADRVKEESTSTGTGNFSLGGAVSKFVTFGSRMANNDTTYYCIEHQAADEWEVGFGTWQTGGTLVRTTVLQSSNADAAVNFSAGTKHVFMTLPSIAAGFGALTVTPSADQNDYDPTGLKLASRLLINPSASMKLTGLAGGHDTRRIIIHNTGTDYLVWLEHENTASAAGNRFKLRDEMPLFLMPNDWAEFVYHGSRWDYIGGNQPGGPMGLETFYDFLYAQSAVSNQSSIGPFGIIISGAGATAGMVSSGVDTTNKPLGQVAIAKGSSTTGRAGYGAGGTSGTGTMPPGLGWAFSIARLRLPITVDATDTFVVQVGYIDSGDNAINHGVYWEYRWNGSAAEWSQARAAGGSVTRSTTGSPSPSNDFVWPVIFINPGWTRVDFIYSTDGRSFTKADSPTTGIPGSTQPVSAGIMIIGSAGTANRQAILDLLGFRHAFARV